MGNLVPFLPVTKARRVSNCSGSKAVFGRLKSEVSPVFMSSRRMSVGVMRLA